MPAYRDEKTKTWYVKFRFRDWQGKSKHTTKRGFKTKKDALNYEHEFKATAEERVDITVASLAEKYLEDRRLYVKASSFSFIEQTIRVHILPYIGALKLTELSPSVMRHWQNELKKQNFSPSTLSGYNRRCSALLNFAVKYYGLNSNPLRAIGSIGQAENRVDFWELSEFQHFITFVKNPRHRICFLLLFYSGMRIGELRALNAGDFDFDNNQISITKSRMRINGEITTPKTKYSIRIIDMPPKIMQEVKNYIDSLDEVTTPLFTLDLSPLSMALKKYATKAGLKPIRIHDLRHSHASLLIHNGFPITLISKRLGHKSPDITLKVYSHMYKESGTKVAQFLQDNLVSQNVVKDD
ncbi:MAG: site-specific integrase [Selenomonadaceae bacterium]|nr:site-specific integrase [Selenomonadaceae bacterium]